MRDKQSKFQNPIELDIPLPKLGVDVLNIGETDFQYCRGSTNMWLSPAGNLESRPAFRTIIDKGEGPVRGLFMSKIHEKIFMVRGTTLYSWDSTSGLSPIGAVSGANEKVCMVEFLDKIYLASGGVLQYTDGNSLTTQGAAANMRPTPELDFIDTWQERLWGFKGDTLYGSSYRATDDFGPINSSITTSLGGEISVRPNDGSSITGFCIFQGDMYLTKAAINGANSSFWKVTGTSFRADSTTPYSVTLINNGIGCIDPFTMAPVLNSVMFCGDDGNVYSETLVDGYAYPQSIPSNNRVIVAFRGDHAPWVACYQPRLGYYFVLLHNSYTGYSEIWAYHVATKGWWRWELLNIKPIFLAAGDNDDLLVGDVNGMVHRLQNGTYGADGDGDMLSMRPYVSVLLLGVIDANSARDKFFEWLFVDYLPLGQAGQMWVDYREGRGYSNRFTTSQLSDPDRNKLSVGWDYVASQWDVPEVGWDMGGIVEVMNRVNRRTSTLQIGINGNTPFRLIGLTITGGVIANRTRSWHRG